MSIQRCAAYFKIIFKSSAGVVIDALRMVKLAKDRGVGGPLLSPSVFFMKHPPVQFTDSQAYEMVEEFIAGKRER